MSGLLPLLQAADEVEADEALRWVTNVEEFKMQMRGITRGGSMSPAPVEAPVPVQTYSIADAFSTSRPGSR